MSRQYLTNKTGKRIGSIDDQPNQQIGYDAIGRKIGRYDKRTNVTYDAIGRKIGSGNLLATLID